ncbi:azurin [Entomomonas asaccharolytica]|uniref:Azurin n=1 Tax=Entomomonas asaccharolytica TaxID=2785331 RepID=A0A974NDW1_9GAMM|nr:azurin [Entomomonas asaccharolytica]QQP84960.1 azurin [Entomomonas asaccharolytica]
MTTGYIKPVIVGLVMLLGAISHVIASPSCSITIHSNDRIEWDTDHIKVSQSCQSFTINLIHDGHLDKGVMGHNWVLTKAQDKEQVAQAVILEKETDYINNDPRIIAHTKLIGGGQRTTITFGVSQLQQGQQYSFFCSYPEHIGLMQGTLELVD